MKLYSFSTNELVRVDKVRQYAESNPLSMDDLLDIYNKQKKPPGDIREHVFVISGMKGIFSMESQVDGMIRHASFSLVEGGLPPIGFVNFILKTLGFTKMIISDHQEYFKVDLDFEPGAVNIWELVQ